MNIARDANDRRAIIHPLKDGDALMVAPPRGGEGMSPWLIERISTANGAVLWQKDLLRENDRNLPGLTWVVDEHRGQIVAFWSFIIAAKMHLDVISYDLITGAERWRSTYNYAGEFAGGIIKATLGDNGDIVAWGRHAFEEERVKWWRWHHEEGFWFPESETIHHEQPLRVVFSGSNGALQERGLVARLDERINAVLTRKEGTVAEVLFLREMKRKEQIEPWRALRLAGGRGLAGGSAARLDFPRDVVLTPAGHIVIAGDPAADKGVWRITVW